jgi:hypothetical protein
MNCIILNKNTYLRQILSSAKRERAVPCPDVVHWVSAARPSGGKTATARFRDGDVLPAAQRGFNGRLRVFTFHNVSNANTLVTIFT